MALIGNGFLVSLLSITSFQTNKLAGALTLTVCANIKQCLTIFLGVAQFDAKVNLLNGTGMLIALFGAAWYSRVEVDAKKPATRTRYAIHTAAIDIRMCNDATLQQAYPFTNRCFKIALSLVIS